ncbi:hypothetical protein SAZ11_47950 [Streptomyces sp. FXJ1.4098]|nr:hypothetical protein [Streptomyces sp. FXJ1.4098]
MYFLDKGQPVAVVTGESPTTPEEAVRILLRGPEELLEDRGLTTALSPVKPLSVESRRGGTVTIRLPAFVKLPSRLGLDQLVCTAAAAEVIAEPDVPSVTVVVSASESWRYTGRGSDCPAN